MATDEIVERPLSELLQGVTLTGTEVLTVQIYRLLWNLIVTLRLLPGQMIAEKEIGECLQASKTPVREALIRLEEAGLVRIVPKSGTYVSSVRISTYIEACFIRLQLEIGAVRRAAGRRRDNQQQAVLDEIIEQQVNAIEADEQERFFALDEKLHEGFFVMAGVQGAWDVLRRTQAEVYRIRHLKRVHRIRREQQVLADHQEIVEAIRAGDADLAEQSLVAHIGPLESEIEELSANTALLEFIETQGNAGWRTESRRGTRAS